MRFPFKMPSTVAGAAAALALFGLAASPAHALPTTWTFDLTSDHCTGGCLTGPSGGTVTVTENAVGTLSFEVNLAAGFGIVDTGAGASFLFNLNGNPNVSFSLPSGFGVVGGANPTGAQTISTGGAGDFEYGITCRPSTNPKACGPGGSSPFFGTLAFDISAPGLTLADLEQNSGPLNNYFAIDVKSTNGNTGNIDASSFTCTSGCDTPVPEPASMALLGSALLGFGVLRRRKRA